MEINYVAHTSYICRYKHIYAGWTPGKSRVFHYQHLNHDNKVKNNSIQFLSLTDLSDAWTVDNTVMFLQIPKFSHSSCYLGVANEATRHVAKLVEKQKKPSKPRKRTLIAVSRRPVPVPLVNHHLQSQVKELLTAYPSGLLSNMFCSAFRRRFGEELDFRKVGFRTIEELLRAIPGITVTIMPSGESRIFGLGSKCQNGRWLLNFAPCAV